MDANGTPLSLDTNGVVSEFSGGPRVGEDILMTNVVAFDIKVWDGAFSEADLNGDGVFDPNEDVNGNGQLDLLGGFADLGHDGQTGFYKQDSGGSPNFGNQNLNYGPLNDVDGTQNRVFDTWHTAVDLNSDSTPELPPFRPINPGANGVYETAKPSDDFPEPAASNSDHNSVSRCGTDHSVRSRCSIHSANSRSATRFRWRYRRRRHTSLTRGGSKP